MGTTLQHPSHLYITLWYNGIMNTIKRIAIGLVLMVMVGAAAPLLSQELSPCMKNYLEVAKKEFEGINTNDGQLVATMMTMLLQQIADVGGIQPGDFKMVLNQTSFKLQQQGYDVSYSIEAMKRINLLFIKMYKECPDYKAEVDKKYPRRAAAGY